MIFLPCRYSIALATSLATSSLCSQSRLSACFWAQQYPKQHPNQKPTCSPTSFRQWLNRRSSVVTNRSNTTKKDVECGSPFPMARMDMICGWLKTAKNSASIAKSTTPFACSSSGKSFRSLFSTNSGRWWVRSLAELANAFRNRTCSSLVSLTSSRPIWLISLTILKPPWPIILPTVISLTKGKTEDRKYL